MSFSITFKNGGEIELMATESRSRRGKQKTEKSNLTLKIELLDGNRIVGSSEVPEIESEEEGQEMLASIEELLEKDFDCDFEESEEDDE